MNRNEEIHIDRRKLKLLISRNMKIEYTFHKSYRKFNADTTRTLNINENGINYICAPNGYGKSTLIHILRGMKDSLKDERKSMFDGMTSSRLEQMKGIYDDVVSVNGFDADEAFYLDSVVDDPMSFENAATAWGLVAGGGMDMQRHSRGENSQAQLMRFHKRITNYLIKNYGSIAEWKASGKKGIVFLDECDEGIEVNIQLIMNRFLYKKFVDELGLMIVSISHTPLCMMGRIDDCKVNVYDAQFDMLLMPEDYFEIITGGISLKLDYTKYDNYKSRL